MLRLSICLAAALAASPALAGDCSSSCPASRAAHAAHHQAKHNETKHNETKHREATHHVAAKKVAHAAAEADLVDTAVAAGDFNTLVAAVQAADLVNLLKSEGPFTVFAPTDEAFAKLPEGTVESLLEPHNKQRLKTILKYHVVPGRVLAKDVVGRRSVKTVQGAEVAIGVAGERVFLNNAQLTAADVATSNGVIHVIDSVLMPAE